MEGECVKREGIRGKSAKSASCVTGGKKVHHA